MIFIRLLSAALFVIGLGGFLAPFWLGSVQNAGTIELPLVEIEDVAVAHDGRIYFALMHLARLQIYTGDGRFIRNIPVSNAGGAFCLDVTDNRLTVAVARRDAADTFDLDGHPSTFDTPIDEDRYHDVCRRDPRIKSVDWTVSEVTLNYTDGRRLIFQRQVWHYAALGPFWSWLMFAIALFLWPEWRRGVLKRMWGSSDN
jgi:hypothetical protein